MQQFLIYWLQIILSHGIQLGAWSTFRGKGGGPWCPKASYNQGHGLFFDFDTAICLILDIRLCMLLNISYVIRFETSETDNLYKTIYVASKVAFVLGRDSVFHFHDIIEDRSTVS